MWIDIFKNDYAKLLDRGASGAARGLVEGLYKRAEGFQIIFETLLEQKSNDFAIIETGTVRKPNNWKDGNSGFLFSEMVRLHGGFVRSVDIDQTAVDTANQFIDQQYYRSFCSDSVAWPGCVVAIDDNSRLLETNKRTGKGRMIVEYLDSKGIVPVYDAYQIIYKF